MECKYEKGGIVKEIKNKKKPKILSAATRISPIGDLGFRGV